MSIRNAFLFDLHEHKGFARYEADAAYPSYIVNEHGVVKVDITKDLEILIPAIKMFLDEEDSILYDLIIKSCPENQKFKTTKEDFVNNYDDYFEKVEEYELVVSTIISGDESFKELFPELKFIFSPVAPKNQVILLPTHYFLGPIFSRSLGVETDENDREYRIQGAGIINGYAICIVDLE